MPKITRPPIIPGNFDGVTIPQMICAALRILFWGTIAFVVVDLFFIPFFWWVARLVYLYQKPHLVQSYSYQMPAFPRREKQHAFCAGACLVIAVLCGIGWYFGVPKLPAFAVVFALGYVGLSGIHYLNVREDPYGYEWK